MSVYPNLKGVVTKDLVEKVDAGKYKADYVNWSRTMQVLRDHAPGWLPELIQTAEGGYVHRGGVGGFLLIRFVHESGAATPGFPQAIMDNRNQAIPVDKITARDITDTHRRGACMAAAFAFGLAYELWAKMPLESGFAAPQPEPPAAPVEAKPVAPVVAAEVAPPEQIEQFWGLVAKVAAVDPKGKTVDWWHALADKAAEKKHTRPVAHLTADELAGLAVEFQKHYATLKGSGGEVPAPPSPDGIEPSGDGSPAPPEQTSAGEQPSGDGSSAIVEATDAPAEQTTMFQAPTGPRGSKARQHKDVAA